MEAILNTGENTLGDMMGGLPEGVQLPEAPPAGFDPMGASNDLLVRHGLPPRPDQSSEPESYAWWMKVCSWPRTYVAPGFERLSVRPASSGEQQSTVHRSKRWSGAVISATQGFKFEEIRGSWDVSRPFPDNLAWRPKHWDSGTFRASTWVGIDGYQSHDVLQAGTGHICTTSIHQDTEYHTHAWWEWFPQHAWRLTGFQVKPGDLVHSYIRATDSTHAMIYFYNDSACTYTSFHVTAPNGVSLKGNSAEWIVEASRESSPPQTAYLGATFIFDCEALEQDSRHRRRHRDLTGAIFLQADQDGEVLSTARSDLSNNKVVGILAERRTNETFIPTI
ncbi:Aspergillopepsin-2 [Tolypocladium ophioglossoides CBS 100239]|uniref:Aspergillopepsin-2 n=1 Tax=Tolypocladium ophioglossoides (strain CBS 100239) TaxID=1163406 RepID=A0A0L0NIH9_TOLOC|nr:Aspergillopepsin-2 [Tolypocladium ophioglossoides CBS 100239]